MLVISIITFAKEKTICKIVSSILIIIHIKESVGWVQLSCVRDSFPLWRDSILDPSFSGIACPSWYRNGSSLLSLAPTSRTAPSQPPPQWALHPARSHLERKGWPQLPLEVVSSVPHLVLGSPGSWPLNRLSSHVRKLIVPFSLHCQLLPILQITGQISKADTGSPWDAGCYPEIPS